MNTVLVQLFLLSTLAPAQAPAQWITVQAHLQTTSDASAALTVGQPFELVIEAEHSPGSIALLPQDLGLPGALAERTSARVHRRTPGQQADRDVYVLQLLAFETGQHEIPALPLAMGSTTASSPAITVTVGSVLSTDEQMVASSTRPEALEELEKFTAGTAPPEKVLVPDYRVFWVLLVVAAIVIAALWLLRLSGRKKAQPEALEPPPPPRPAHEVALEAIERLKAEDPLASGAFKTHYTALSTILREYVGARFGFDSLELTYDELSEALRRHSAAGLKHDEVEELLFTADQVKFAKFVPLAEDGYEALRVTERIVRQTKAIPAPEEAPSQ